MNAYSQQQISFNKIYNPGKFSTSGSAAIIKKGNGYLIQALQWDTLSRVMFIEIDSIGNIKKIITLGNDTLNFYCGLGSLIQTQDNGYCFAGDVQGISSLITYHCLIKLDNNLNTVFIKYYYYISDYELFNQIYETHDKSLIMVGDTYINSTTTNVLIFKTDSLGNKLWERSLATGGLSCAWQVRETPDKGLLMSCFKGQVGNPFILKTDSLGYYKWSNSPNSQQYNTGNAIAITNEGDYLFAYGFGTYTYPTGIDCLAKLNIIKYNPQGSIIWNRFYDTLTIDFNPVKIEVLPNGDFYVLSNYLIGDMYGDNQPNSTLMKFNSYGDSLWTQRYSYSGIIGSISVLYDGTLTNDGGFIACGYITDLATIPQSVWVLKTDSLGNAPGMQYMGINEITRLSSKGDIKVFPNPATVQTTITYPQQINEGDILIYNTLGQLIFEEKLAKASTQKEINIQSFKAGLYKVILREKGIIMGQVSLVKE